MVSELTGASAVQARAFIQCLTPATSSRQPPTTCLALRATKPSKDLQAATLSGIRELYLMLTGDYDLHGGFNPDRAQLATTADFTGLVKNALNKIVVNTWDSARQSRL